MFYPKTLSFLLLIIFCTTFSGCDDDDDNQSGTPGAEDFILNEPIFDCASNQSFATELPNISGSTAIMELLTIGDRIYLRSSEAIFLLTSPDDPTPELILEGQTRKMAARGTDLLACRIDGVYVINEDNEVTRTTDLNCTDLIVGQEDRVYFTGDAFFENNVSSEQVVELNIESGTVTSASPRGVGNDLLQLTQAADGIFWATIETMNNEPELVHFTGGDEFTTYTTQNSPLKRYNVNHFLLPYQDGLVFFSFTGGFRKQLLKFADGEWVTLLDTDPLEMDLTDKFAYVAGPSPTDVFILNDKLYVTTTATGCRGLMRYDLRPDRLLLEEEIDAIQAPELDGDCLQGIIRTPEAASEFIIYTQGGFTTYSSC